MMAAYRYLVMAISLPLILAGFFDRATGRSYGIGLGKKVRLFLRFVANRFRIPTASNFIEHVIIAKAIMDVPPEVQGVVVECGCYKGGSSANLSLVCAAVGRQMHIFDSFEGLPEPGAADQNHLVLASGEIHQYGQGYWRGSEETVRANLTRFGRVDVCTLHRGYFNRTLPDFKLPVVMAFLDADLRESTRECLSGIWPSLQDGCRLFIHEAQHEEVVSLFFEREHWPEGKAPGLIGAGTGIGLVPEVGGFRSSLAYSVKNPNKAELRVSVERGLAS